MESMEAKPIADKGSRSPNEFDLIVAERVRKERVRQGRTLQEVGEACGISHQQLQKYEVGTNRMSIGMYRLICNALRVPLDYFLNDPDELKKDQLPFQVKKDLSTLHKSLGHLLARY